MKIFTDSPFKPAAMMTTTELHHQIALRMLYVVSFSATTFMAMLVLLKNAFEAAPLSNSIYHSPISTIVLLLIAFAVVSLSVIAPLKGKAIPITGAFILFCVTLWLTYANGLPTMVTSAAWSLVFIMACTRLRWASIVGIVYVVIFWFAQRYSSVTYDGSAIESRLFFTLIVLVLPLATLMDTDQPFEKQKTKAFEQLMIVSAFAQVMLWFIDSTWGLNAIASAIVSIGFFVWVRQRHSLNAWERTFMVSIPLISYSINMVYSSGLTLFVLPLYILAIFLLLSRYYAVILSMFYVVIAVGGQNLLDGIVMRGTVSGVVFAVLLNQWFSFREVNSSSSKPFSTHNVMVAIGCGLLFVLATQVIWLVGAGQYQDGITQYRAWGLTFVFFTLITWVVYEYSILLDKEREERDSAVILAQQSSKTKSDFLANMSHEIRTPMNAVLGLAQLLNNDNKYPTAVTSSAKKIVRSGESLQNLLNDILDFSKIESGKLELINQPFSFSEIEDQVALLMRTDALNKEIELIIKPSDYLSLKLIGDSQRVEQVLVNLIANAIKFTDKGHVALTLEVTQLPTDQFSGSVTFSVVDTGIGMTPEQLQRVVQPFSQADSSTTRIYGGTGLGLSISQRLLELMGSSLTLESKKGEGTRASFSLPLAFAKEAPSHPLPDAAPQKTVVIAVNHPMTRDALCANVALLGLRAIPVVDVTTVGEVCKSLISTGQTPDFIFLDGLMTSERLAFTAELKALALDLSSVITPKIVGLIDHQLTQAELRLKADVDSVLEKPVTISDMRSLIFTLPTETSVDADITHQISPRLDGIKLLVADDHLINREVAYSIFTGEGAEVFTVEDGQQAVDWLKTSGHQVDAVLMDIHMPVVDGLEAAKLLRAERLFDALPIIGLSASVYDSDIKTAKEAGMNGYITKPININTAVDHVLQFVETDHRQRQGRRIMRNVDHAGTRVFDLEGALRVWGSPQKAAKYLALFNSEFGANLTNIQRNIHTVSAHYLHKMKGAAGAMHLNALVKVIQQCESEIVKGTISEETLADVNTIWRETRQRITEFLSEHTQTAPNVDPTEEKRLNIPDPLIEALMISLDTFNRDKVFAVLKPIKGCYANSSLTRFESAVLRFDFKEARQILNQLRDLG